MLHGLHGMIASQTESVGCEPRACRRVEPSADFFSRSLDGLKANGPGTCLTLLSSRFPHCDQAETMTGVLLRPVLPFPDPAADVFGAERQAVDPHAEGREGVGDGVAQRGAGGEDRAFAGALDAQGVER